MRFAYPRGRRRPPHPAVDGIDLEIESGAAVALLGPNGSGKSTLIRLICSTVEADEGTIEIFGRPLGPPALADLGVVFQTPALDRLLTARENLHLQARLHGLARREASARSDEALAQAGLTERSHHLAGTLSGGLARRLDLVRSLVHRPRLLVLDEPAVGLDPPARAGFLDLLWRRRAENGLTILMSTHMVDEAERCQRVILLHQGRIVADGAPGALRAQLGRLVLTVHDPAWEPGAGAGTGWRRHPEGWKLYVDDEANRIGESAALLARRGIPYTLAPVTLADVFSELGGAGLEAGAP